MVSIVTTYKDNKKYFLHYWLPLIYKHKEVEFIIIDNKSISKPIVDYFPTDTKNLIVFGDKSLTGAISKARNETVFITDINCLPTYECMITLDKYKGKNVMVQPRWHHYMQNDFDNSICETSFSVLRDQYRKVKNKEEYIHQYSPEIIDKGHVYLVKD